MIAVDLASDKDATKKLLGNMGVPVPKGYQIVDEDELEEAIERLGFPVAIKPLDANHGKGITVGLKTLEEVRAAFPLAKKYSRRVIIEQSLTGQDFRALVINNRLVAVSERIPAHITGDGEHTIQELIDQTNRDPRRGYGHENVLTLIEVDAQTTKLLTARGYTLDTVMPAGEMLYLKTTANISTGGTAIDRTDDVHPVQCLALRAHRAHRRLGHRRDRRGCARRDDAAFGERRRHHRSQRRARFSHAHCAVGGTGAQRRRTCR
jgi:cyanophycin synthetase